MIGLHVSLSESGKKVIHTAVPSLEQHETKEAKTERIAAAASSGGLRFEFISITDPAVIDDTITVMGKTAPGAECELVVTLSSGSVSGFPKEPVQTADEQGSVKWEWVLFRHTPPGETKLEVTAREGDVSVTATLFFTAQR